MIKYRENKKVLRFMKPDRLEVITGELHFTKDDLGSTITIGCGSIAFTVPFDDVYQLIKQEILAEEAQKKLVKN